jgi:mono/diheme cytochrome c family protein
MRRRREAGVAARCVAVRCVGYRCVAAAVIAFVAAGAAAQDNAEPPHPGKAVYDKWCTPCHGDGPGKPGTMVLRQRYGASLPAVLEERDDMTAEYLETFVRQGVGVMPQFRKTEITDGELRQMIDYLLR